MSDPFLKVLEKSYDLPADILLTLDANSRQILNRNRPLLKVETVSKVLTLLFHEAVDEENYNLVEALIGRDQILLTPDAVTIAVRQNSLKMFQLLNSYEYPLTQDHLLLAIRLDHSVLSKALIRLGVSVSTDHLIAAVINNDTDLIRLLLRRDLDYYKILPQAFNNLSTLDFLLDKIQLLEYQMTTKEYSCLLLLALERRQWSVVNSLSKIINETLLEPSEAYLKAWEQHLVDSRVVTWLFKQPVSYHSLAITVQQRRFDYALRLVKMLPINPCVDLSLLVCQTSGDASELLKSLPPFKADLDHLLLAMTHNNLQCCQYIINRSEDAKMWSKQGSAEIANALMHHMATISTEVVRFMVDWSQLRPRSVYNLLLAAIGTCRHDLIDLLVPQLNDRRSQYNDELLKLMGVAKLCGNHQASQQLNNYRSNR